MTQDTRKDRRVKIVSLNVRYKSATVDEFIENHAHDVSRGGIFIKTGNPFPPGTLLKFEIRLASDQAVIAGVGRIVWKRDAGVSDGEHPAGMGVKFIDIDEASQGIIDRLVNTRSDAGRAYEDESVGVDRSFSRSSPPPRTSLPSTTPPPAGAASAHLAAHGSVPGAKTTSAPPEPKTGRLQSMPTTAATPFARKATIMGLGSSSAPPARSSQPPSGEGATGSIPPPGRLPFSTAPSVPPRPGNAAAMFPRRVDDESDPPKEDQTVMRQAAELLEDALREAGGSMAEIGHNPLFPGSGAAGGSAPTHMGPVTPASDWTAADSPKALAESAKRSDRPVVVGQTKADRDSGAPQSVRTGPSSKRPASAVAMAEVAPATKKKGASALIWVVIIGAGVISGVVAFREELFGKTAPPEPAPVPTMTAKPEPAALASEVTSAPPVVPPPVATLAPAPSEAPAASAAASASASSHAAPEPPTAKPPPSYAPRAPGPPRGRRPPRRSRPRHHRPRRRRPSRRPLQRPPRRQRRLRSLHRRRPRPTRPRRPRPRQPPRARRREPRSRSPTASRRRTTLTDAWWIRDSEPARDLSRRRCPSATMPSKRWVLRTRGFAAHRGTRTVPWAAPTPESRSRDFPSASKTYPSLPRSRGTSISTQ